MHSKKQTPEPADPQELYPEEDLSAAEEMEPIDPVQLAAEQQTY